MFKSIFVCLVNSIIKWSSAIFLKINASKVRFLFCFFFLRFKDSDVRYQNQMPDP